MKLHLGCGDEYREGWVNVDHLSPIADEHVNLASFPWPWEDNVAEEVYLEQVLEHFDRPEFVLREIHRVLAPGGTVHVITPHRDSVSACMIDHRAFFSRCFFETFTNPTHYWIKQHGDCWFEEVSYRVLIIKKPWLKWTPFDWMASRFAMMWEKFSFGVFRPGEIIWIARKPRHNPSEVK